MPVTALHRLEALLASRQLDHTLTPAWRDVQAVPTASTGAEPLDAVLGGGWRMGEISEIVGPRSSGRTGLLWSTLARGVADGHVVALVDTLDRFDPVLAATAGLDLSRMLWVRGATVVAERARSPLVETAVQRAIRAFDLILRAGGFGIVALDLMDVPTRQLCVLPASTWLRLAHVMEGRPVVGLLAGDAPIGRSARGATVHLSSRREWTGTSLQQRRLSGLQVRARVARMALSGAETPEWIARAVPA